MRCWAACLGSTGNGQRAGFALMVELRMERASPQLPLAAPPFHTWAFPDGVLWTEFHRADGGYLRPQGQVQVWLRLALTSIAFPP